MQKVKKSRPRAGLMHSLAKVLKPKPFGVHLEELFYGFAKDRKSI